MGSGLLFLAAVMLSGFSGAWLEHQSSDGVSIGNLSDQKRVVASQSQLISHIAKTVGPSVVSVNVSTNFAQAAGTGIIISSKGLVVTNRHVVPAGTTSVSVTLSDGTELKNVSVLGRTSETDSLDVAFLQITDAKGHKLVPAIIGNSAGVQVGDNVVAIGNALGQFQNTVTSGIISGFGRRIQASSSSSSDASVENLDNLFQTDTAINEGNSGGPLVNLDGQVIAINTAVAGDAQNVGFAIPINDVRGLIDQVVKTGKFARPYLGVRYIPLTADVASEFGLSVTQGAFIVPSADSATPSIIPDGPAVKAGLQEKDIIIGVDDKKIDQTHSLTSLLTPHKPGDKVNLAVLRGSKTIHLNVTLGELPAN